MTERLVCESCGVDIGPDEPVYYECPDGLPGHDWLNCAACHKQQFPADATTA